MSLLKIYVLLELMSVTIFEKRVFVGINKNLKMRSHWFKVNLKANKNVLKRKREKICQGNDLKIEAGNWDNASAYRHQKLPPESRKRGLQWLLSEAFEAPKRTK